MAFSMVEFTVVEYSSFKTVQTRVMTIVPFDAKVFDRPFFVSFSCSPSFYSIEPICRIVPNRV